MDNKSQQERRQGKRRRTKGDSDESDDMRKAIRRSKLDDIAEISSEEEVQSQLWSDANLLAAQKELNREQGSQEDSMEYKCRCAAQRRNEHMLKEEQFRRDVKLANQLSAEDVQIAADYAMAQQIYQKEKDRLACRRSEIKEARDALGKNWAKKRKEKVRTPNPAVSTAPPSRGTIPNSVKVEGSLKANVEAPAPVAEATTIPKRECKVHDLKDRIALQKIRQGDLEAKGWLGYTDQGLNGTLTVIHLMPTPRRVAGTL
ncbi:hypothetical protein B0H16DRAFT_1749324 [Mycena metata]|uniref:Uncharacterized protein n=1 Tax=Mycena metata TaxID=1033252 RepID=A0AAD7GKS6_9AGAR|nr:hypothetical protein B0H16DRAFT_1749324 [Mycena metata]